MGTIKSLVKHVDFSSRAFVISIEEEEQSVRRSVFGSFTSDDENGSVLALMSCVNVRVVESLSVIKFKRIIIVKSVKSSDVKDRRIMRIMTNKRE